jgi:hypothetical protein
LPLAACACANASAGIAIAQITLTTRTTETLNIVACLPDNGGSAAARRAHKSHQLSCYLRLGASIQCAYEPSRRAVRLNKDAARGDLDPR